MSQILLRGRKIEKNLKSKKPHRELSRIWLLLLEVWGELKKECGMNQGSAELGTQAGQSGRSLRVKAAPRPAPMCSALQMCPGGLVHVISNPYKNLKLYITFFYFMVRKTWFREVG